MQALGVDAETYRVLIELQFREIKPEDYTTLSVLDETVAAKSLDRKKLNLLPTRQVVSSAEGDLAVRQLAAVEIAHVMDRRQSIKMAISATYRTQCAWYA